MTTFFVGQRVRIKDSPNPDGRHLIGTECRIISDGCVDGYPRWFIDIIGPDGEPWGADKDEASDIFEPIQYDGMQPVEWSECLWQPEGVEA